MRTLARVGAIASFTFFFIPGAWLALPGSPEHERGAVIFGLILLGIAFFVGPMLWLAGEKCCSKQNGK